MKIKSSKIIAFLLAAVIIFCAAPIAVNASEATDLFGRTALSSLDNGDELVKAYDIIVDGVEDRLGSIDLESSVNINVDELSLVMEAYFNDPHGHFWTEQGYSYYSYTSGRATSLIPKYNGLAGNSDAEFESNVALFESTCKSILTSAGVRSNMSDYEKELRIHNELVKRADYQDGINAHNAFGAIVEETAVCQGYTLAFNYLLRLCGIQSYTVHGIAGGGPHCWSMVRIDGEYYHTDITWADPVGSPDPGTENDIYYCYFNVTRDTMAKDHFMEESSFTLPQCNSTEAGYFAKNPQAIFKSDITSEKMAALVKNGMIRLLVPNNDFNSLQSWLSYNAYDLFLLTGYDLTQPISLSFTYLGNEYHVYLIGTKIEPEITYTIGDLNGDGSIDAKDSNILLRIVAGSVTPTEDQIIIGDINGDGEINAKDSNLMKRIISGALTV